MANSEYQQRGVGAFSSYIKNDQPLDYFTTTIDYTDFNFDSVDPIQPGFAALVDDEIMRVETVGIRTITVKRGCADTIPAQHVAGSIIWILNGGVGTDNVERSAGETASVKVSPFTLGGGNFPIASTAPDAVTFDWRFFRPYPPGRVEANAAPFFAPHEISDDTGGLGLTWVHRDRVLQADQLLGHDAPSIGPEAGTTYTLEVFSQDNTLLRTEYGIRGENFLYQQAKALFDFGKPAQPATGYAVLSSERENFQSMYGYRMPFTVQPSALPIPSQWVPFDQQVFEAPYVYNARHGLAYDGTYALGVAARPSDRMSDTFDLMERDTEQRQVGEDEEGNPIYWTFPISFERDHAVPYTPWITIDFRLPELETTAMIRSSSLFDGITTGNVGAGTLALIDDELVAVVELHADRVVLLRGVGDTIPAVHIAGSRLWLFENREARDDIDRSAWNSVDYRFRPGVFGDPVDVEALPARTLTFTKRAQRPYPVGQLVVNGRPWFEEAQAVSGQAVAISWAWRSSTGQGAELWGHATPGGWPETGGKAVLTFFYETPSSTPGQPPVEHVLRTFTVDPLAANSQTGSFNYSYADAQADGNTAGLATGVCGTVVIFCRLSTLRGAFTSRQSYIIPIRVPSYPCPA